MKTMTQAQCLSFFREYFRPDEDKLRAGMKTEPHVTRLRMGIEGGAALRMLQPDISIDWIGAARSLEALMKELAT